VTCPTCRSPWREQPECPRCGSDLTPLMQLAAEAWRHRAAATAALADGRWPDALHHAAAADRLHRTDAGTDLLRVTRLLGAEP
jgi:predicted amidophosphoribosyltransferase